MKGIILAGGTGSRLYPLTKVINKHLLPIGNKPMIYYAIEKLVNANINNIMIVTGTEHCGTIISQCGDGSDFNCKLTYKIQQKAGGIAEALSLTKEFVGNDKCCVILGDNIFNFDLKYYVNIFENQTDYGANIFLKSVEDAWRFGVANGYRKPDMSSSQLIVTNIIEKPKNVQHGLAVTGIYFYDNSLFSKISTITPSARGELEITDVNNLYVKEQRLMANVLDDSIWWTDAGTFDSLAKANYLIGKESK